MQHRCIWLCVFFNFTKTLKYFYIVKDDKYKRISCDVYDQYERMGVQKKTILLTVMGDMMVTQIEGKIKTLETKNKEEFMILESGERIRLDNIINWTELD